MTTEGIDHIVAVAKAWLDLLQQAKANQGKFEVEWSCGKKERFTCHLFFVEQEISLAGTCIDLKDAYRQFAARDRQRKYSTFGTLNPETGETEFFMSTALFFGISAGPFAFNRAAHLLSRITHSFEGAAPTNFFDDFVLIAPVGVTEKLFDRTLRLWETSSDGT